MAWTEERVAVLTRLWSEGLSASQIARQLGDVTRNAVIGKVHRLGLSGRATPSRAERPRVSTRKKRPPKPMIVMPETVKEAILGDGSYVTVRTLKESMCKWPYGDPSSSEFHFCGQGNNGTGPYCEAHAAVAYQPMSSRRGRAAQPAVKPVFVQPGSTAVEVTAETANVTQMKPAAELVKEASIDTSQQAQEKLESEKQRATA